MAGAKKKTEGSNQKTDIQRDDLSVNNSAETTFNSYDDFPYTSYPFAQTRPEYLRTIGKLFGLNPPAIETARILELGCAAGGNIISFAESYPDSYTLGVDLSEVQIKQGIELVNKLSLKNIELKNLSITDLDESFGKFDYIICHGVFSWVPQEVRDKIIKISKQLLNPQGISYISYNTLPGWNVLNSIRDMMMFQFQSTNFEDVPSKLQQAKLLVNFVNESLSESNSAYANLLKEEVSQLNQRRDDYLRHDYLSAENKQFYFHEFMKEATQEGMIYLGDANLPSMFLGNLPVKAVEKLQDVKNIIMTEQYMDFIQNRRFRSTLLCHPESLIDRNITPDNINRFYMTSNIVTEKTEKEVDIKNSLESIGFYLESLQGANANTASPVMKAIFYTLIENRGNPLKSNELLKIASTKLPSYKLSDFEKEFNDISARLVFTGFLKLFENKPKAISSISAMPMVSNLARCQAEGISANQLLITNQINEVIALNSYEIAILQNLDGNNDLTKIVDIILSQFSEGKIKVSQGETTITDKEALTTLAKKCVDLALERFRTNYLLVK
ncbi:MAG: methyltransferase domain-containing protein [Rickettsiaceae bacterium]|nr:MAG: methyltransferase domain-containing protein [Rickettsiaceae bacterium]